MGRHFTTNQVRRPAKGIRNKFISGVDNMDNFYATNNMTKKNALFMGMLCLSVMPSLAQSLEKDTIRLDEVVVTAGYIRQPEVGKLPLPLFKTPIAISQVSRERLDWQGVQTLNEATRTTTGIRPNNTYGGFMTFTMRGFNDFVLLTDGIRDERHNLYQSAPATTLASIDHIEVLKGAASVMYGHSALGGIINLVHKQPTSRTTVNTSLTVGSWGRYQVAGGAGGRLTNWMNFRADFSMAGGDGWRHTNERYVNGYLALDMTFSPQDKLLFSIHAKNDKSGADMGQPHLTSTIYNASSDKAVYEKGDIPTPISRRTRYADPLDHLNDKDITVSLKYTHTFKGTDWKVSDYLSYYHDDLSYYATENLNYLTSSQPIYPYYSKDDKGVRTYVSLDSIRRGGFYFDYQVNLLQNQLELTGKKRWGNTTHHFLAGYNFSAIYLPRYRGSYKDNAYGAGKNSIVTAVDPILNQGNVVAPFSNRHLIHEHNHGFYVQDHIQLGERWSFLGALRFDKFNRSFQVVQTNHKEVISKGTKNKVDNTAITYRLSAMYQIGEYANIYASTSNFFKPTRQVASAGYIYIDNKGNRLTPDGDNVFDPITGYQYEVGSHFSLGKRLYATVTAFYMQKRNMVANLGKVAATGEQITGQVGKADSKGVEIELNALPTPQLRIDAGYTFTHAKVKENAKNEYSKGDNIGNFLAHAPQHMAYGWVYYSVPQTLALKGLQIGVGFQSSSRVYANATNTMSFDPYIIAGAMMSYKRNQWRIQLNVDNLFDKAYYMTSINTTNYVPEPGRNIRCTVAFEL